MALGGDEGRGMAAISLGELPYKLRPEDFRIGKPDHLVVRKEAIPRELKYLSTWRKRNRRDSPSSASEKGAA